VAGRQSRRGKSFLVRPPIGTAEGGAFVTEQLRLDQRGSQRPAVHDLEALRAAVAAFVNLARDERLTGAGLARDQDRGVRSRDAIHHRAHRAHRRR
jgi:hypothetical protein